MDDVFDLFDSFVKNANQAYQNQPKSPPSKNWVECYDLWKTGWKVEEYAETPNSDNIIAKWTKDGIKKEVVLKFSDQIMWFEFLEKTK